MSKNVKLEYFISPNRNFRVNHYIKFNRENDLTQKKTAFTFLCTV